MTLSLTGIGALCLVVAVVGHWLGIGATIRAILAGVGIILVGAGGHGVGILVTIVRWLEGAVSWVTNWITGVHAPWALFVILALVLAYDLHPKHKAGKRTMFVAVAVALILIGGVAQFPILNGIPGGIRNGVENARTAVSMAGR
jgi:hypothetical protein